MAQGPAIPGVNTSNLSQEPDTSTIGRREVVPHGFETHAGGGNMSYYDMLPQVRDGERSVASAADQRQMMFPGA